MLLVLTILSSSITPLVNVAYFPLIAVFYAPFCWFTAAVNVTLLVLPAPVAKDISLVVLSVQNSVAFVTPAPTYELLNLTVRSLPATVSYYVLIPVSRSATSVAPVSVVVK